MGQLQSMSEGVIHNTHQLPMPSETFPTSMHLDETHKQCEANLASQSGNIFPLPLPTARWFCVSS